MRRATPQPDPGPDGAPAASLQSLVALCLDVYEERGAGAVDEVLACHPDSSEAVRERLEVLGKLGMIGEAPADSVPERIGDYRVVRLLGRGGMGVVYEAEQENPSRSVALKVLRSSSGSASRFRHEAQLLARLNHPGIAQVYEAGTATLGGIEVPFFAMELVRGASLVEHARERGLSLRLRLELLASVADAVHHAHNKGVVHRDLKPGNILVDEHGAPRVLDFGVARAIDPELHMATLRTKVGQLVGTLAYMSPEQAAGDPLEVDAQSDVYSLGVVAYELVSGRLPHQVEGLTVIDALRCILEDEPPRLGALDGRLAGDVETIVAKALEKEKHRRYASAHDLAADLRRHLADEPVLARPATATYQLSRFARRHKALVGGAAGILVALFAGLAGTWHGLLRAEEEGADARRRLRQAEAVLDFQRRMFSSADPSADGRNVRVVDVLDRAALELEGAYEDPLEEAAVRRAVGETYVGLGLWDEARGHLVRALETYERELGTDDVQSLETRVQLALLEGKHEGNHALAEELLAGVPESAARILGEDHDVVLGARSALASLWIETGRFEEALALSRELEATASAVDPDHPEALEGMRKRSLALEKLGRFDEAIEAGREVHEWCRDVYGDDHPRTLEAAETLGVALQNSGLAREARPIISRVLDARARLLGEDHPSTLRTMANLGASYAMLGDFETGAELLEDAWALCDGRFGPNHPVTILVANNLSSFYWQLDREDEALVLIEQAVAGSTAIRGASHPDTLSSLGNLALALEGAGRDGEAEDLLTEALTRAREAHGAGELPEASVVVLAMKLGTFLHDHRRFEEAEPLLREALTGSRRVRSRDESMTGDCLILVARQMSATGRLDQAEEHFVEGLAWLERTLGEGHPSTRLARERLDGLRQYVEGLDGG